MMLYTEESWCARMGPTLAALPSTREEGVTVTEAHRRVKAAGLSPGDARNFLDLGSMYDLIGREEVPGSYPYRYRVWAKTLDPMAHRNY